VLGGAPVRGLQSLRTSKRLGTASQRWPQAAFEKTARLVPKIGIRDGWGRGEEGRSYAAVSTEKANAGRSFAIVLSC